MLHKPNNIPKAAKRPTIQKASGRCGEAVFSACSIGFCFVFCVCAFCSARRCSRFTAVCPFRSCAACLRHNAVVSTIPSVYTKRQIMPSVGHDEGVISGTLYGMKATPSFSDASAASRLSQGKKGVWATNLSAGEFLLAKEAGLCMLGQVMGTSVFSPGGSSSSSAISGELKFLTGAYRTAQANAVARLRAEAKRLNANGVVGVQVRHTPFGKPSDGLFEFSLIGTAVKTLHNNPDKTEPFLCSVGGDEYYLLWQAGYKAVGLAVGNCAYFALPRYINSVATQTKMYQQSFERTEYSQAISQARRLAMMRMETDAQAAGGEGIVGVRVRLHKTRPEAGMETTGTLLHFFASGTVIVRASLPPGEKNTPSPILIL